MFLISGSFTVLNLVLLCQFNDTEIESAKTKSRRLAEERDDKDLVDTSRDMSETRPLK